MAAPIPPVAPVTNTARPVKSVMPAHALLPYTLHLVADETVSFAVDGLLLDCDGVLVDSHDAAAVAWNQWATALGAGVRFPP